MNDRISNIFKSVCMVKCTYLENENTRRLEGSGFLCRIFYKDKTCMAGLMTNNHVITDLCLANLRGDKSEIKVENKIISEGLHLKLEDINMIFTSKFLDITFIEFTHTLTWKLERDLKFLRFDTIQTIQTNLKESILCFYDVNDHEAYSEGEAILFGIRLRHECSTTPGSSGGVLVNSNYQIVAVHTAGDYENGYNLCTSMYFISEALKKYKRLFDKQHNRNYKVTQYCFTAKKLSDEDINDLSKKDLNPEQKFRASEAESNDIVFVAIDRFATARSVWFYRTHHGWYWTKYTFKSEENFQFKCEWMPTEIDQLPDKYSNFPNEDISGTPVIFNYLNEHEFNLE